MPNKSMRGVAAALFVSWGVALQACDESPSHVPDELRELDRAAYLENAEYRRTLLEQSLLETNNSYARVRLQHYAKDWDDLQELAPKVAKVIDGQDSPTDLLPIELPGADASELAFLDGGRTAFTLWPSQAMPELELALRTWGEDAADVLGLWRDSQGWLGGLVWVEYQSGLRTIAVTCSTCHARVQDGALVAGAPSDIVLNDAWPPGAVDVTADEVDNPVAIPDLRALSLQSAMHWSGNVESDVGSLVVRIETLLITNAGARARAPREIALGLALYLGQLQDEVQPQAAERAEQTEPEGAEVFHSFCETCHQDPNGAGGIVPHVVVGTDGKAAESAERGTGGYRTPSLLRVAERSHFLHSSYEGTLSDFLDLSSAQRSSYGHAFSKQLDRQQRDQLERYLAIRFSPARPAAE